MQWRHNNTDWERNGESLRGRVGALLVSVKHIVGGRLYSVPHHHSSSTQEVVLIVQLNKFVCTPTAIMLYSCPLHQWILHSHSA